VVLDDNRAGATPSVSIITATQRSREQAMRYFKARWTATQRSLFA
jgi:hypothetical protein